MELLKSVRLLSNVLFYRLKWGNPGEVDRHWENYWRSIGKTGRGGQVLWDNEPERASVEDLKRFKPLILDPSLPLLDFGCGNGRQTRYLATQFDRVIATDVSPSAIAKARAGDARGAEDRVPGGRRPQARGRQGLPRRVRRRQHLHADRDARPPGRRQASVRREPRHPARRAGHALSDRALALRTRLLPHPAGRQPLGAPFARPQRDPDRCDVGRASIPCSAPASIQTPSGRWWPTART